MNENKETIKEHHDNEEVIPVSEPVSEEISREITDEFVLEDGSETDKLNAELAEIKDKFLRLYSEFDNFRKRTQKERIELIKSANADLISNLLPVMDDFERALKFADSTNESNQGKDGVELIYNKLKGILESKGLKKMKSVGELFSDDHHEAIANAPVEKENMKGKIVDEAECGYFLNDKVIRHAKVIVGN